MKNGKMKKKTAVIGFGKTGKAALDFLLNLNHDIYLFNDTPVENPAEQRYYEEKGVTFLVGEKQFQRLTDAELIILSPGVNGRTPRFQELREKGLEVVSEIEFASWFFNAGLIAVTGTNGKSTTVSLIHHILKTGGIKSFLAGNIGTPLISRVDKISLDAVVVLEVSSFQLEEIIRFKPDIAVLLNVTPDHLDRYAAVDDYFSAKLNLVKNQERGDYLVLNYDDPLLRENKTDAGRFGAAQKVWFSRTCRDPDADVYIAGEYIRLKPAHKDTVEREKISLAQNPLRGVHNLENILAAVTAARLAGVEPAKIETALGNFKGLTHRMESLGKIGGVEFINDSKATNVDAALKSIDSIHESLVVIMGGKDKGGDFSILEKTIEEKVDTVLLVGRAAAEIRRQLGLPREKFYRVKDLAEAVAEGFKRLEKKGGVVLLAPACASFDMFENFEHRGQVFKKEVLKLKGQKTKGNEDNGKRL